MEALAEIVDRGMGGSHLRKSPTSMDRVAEAAELLAEETGVEAALVVDLLEELADALGNRRGSTRMALVVDPVAKVCESVATTVCRHEEVPRDSLQMERLKRAVRQVTAGRSSVRPADVLAVLSALSDALRAEAPSTYRLTTDPSSSSCSIERVD